MRRLGKKWLLVIAWLAMNCIIFYASYLNYQIQLKHRYLYRLLSFGLCTSRAAAMVIDVNLLLVWLPMCKYCVTKIVSVWLNRKLKEAESLQNVTFDGPIEGHRHTPDELDTSVSTISGKLSSMATKKVTTTTTTTTTTRKPHDDIQQQYRQFLVHKLSACDSQRQQQQQHQHQTNCIMSTNDIDDIARVKAKCSKQLGYIYMRLLRFLSNIMNALADNSRSVHTVCALSITFASVIHTIAHIMNVINFSRHYDAKLTTLNMASYRGQHPVELLVSVPGITGALMLIILALMSLSSVNSIRNSSYDLFHLLHRLSIVFVILLLIHPSSRILKEQSNVDRHHPEICSLQLNSTDQIEIQHRTSTNLTQTTNNLRQFESITNNHQCPDRLPQFVVQRSISWILLSIGLMCYLLDSLVRRYYRNKNTIELLDAHFDTDGQLIELVMSSNHRRFNHWLPGQFVYVNCPLIASNEWHPFTISSMNEREAQFTLHIKTSGDWTSKLRAHLQAAIEDRQQAKQSKDSSSLTSTFDTLININEHHNIIWNNHNNLIGFNYHKQPQGQQLFLSPDMNKVECTKYSLFTDHHSSDLTQPTATFTNSKTNPNNSRKQMKIYVDGPFRSPYERILSKSVSICLANGVGWTAYSSIFTHLLNNDNNWLAASTAKRCNIHLVVVVTNFEQLRPLYLLLIKYFALCSPNHVSSQCLVREVSAYITRESPIDVLPPLIESSPPKTMSISTNANDNRAIIQINPTFRLLFGRPNFELYFHHIAHLYPDRKASVFCCGSRAVRSQIRQHCRQFNKSKTVKFCYYEE